MEPQNTEEEVSAETLTNRNVSLHWDCILTSLIHVRNNEIISQQHFLLSLIICHV